jgi:hypothetical protein
LDTQKLRELCDQRDAIDAEIAAVATGTTKKDRKSLTCSKCGSPDHTARTCPQKELMPQ